MKAIENKIQPKRIDWILLFNGSILFCWVYLRIVHISTVIINIYIIVSHWSIIIYYT